MDGPPLSTDADPRALPLGIQLGPWRVSGYGGVGVHGAIYRAVRAGTSRAEPAALKLALCPRDPRFEREAQLLSRIRHPGVPRLIDTGQWRHSSGFMHPYLVMEWISGEPLYSWAAHRNPSSRQVLRLLAQGARALQATHAASAVHRDVKGDNMLVRATESRLFLMDFGSGHYPGTERLTPTVLPPSTPAYRSPQAWDYARHQGHRPFALYVASPADDVFAFGVMAYRLVTDEYPPPTDPGRPEGQCWRPTAAGPRPPRALNARVERRLDALIQRMLSVAPEARGTAEELAEALEQQAAQAGPEADVPLFEWETLPRSEWPPEDVAEAGFHGHRPRRRAPEEVRTPLQAAASLERRGPRKQRRSWGHWLAVASAVGLALWPRGAGTGRAKEAPSLARPALGAGEREGGAVSVGDAALTCSQAPEKAAPGSSSEGVIAEEALPTPVPGQLKPDANGRCRKGQFVINRACWWKVAADLDDCNGSASRYPYKEGCYTPAFHTSREPTSAPKP